MAACSLQSLSSEGVEAYGAYGFQADIWLSLQQANYSRTVSHAPPLKEGLAHLPFPLFGEGMFEGGAFLCGA